MGERRIASGSAAPPRTLAEPLSDRLPAEGAATTPMPGVEEMADILRAQDWGRIRAVLFVHARKKGRSAAEAEELADAIIVAACDPDDESGAWNPNERPDVMHHVHSVLRDRLSADRKRRIVRARDKTKENLKLLATPPPPPDPSQLLERRRRQERDDRIVAAAIEQLAQPFDRKLLEAMRRSALLKPAAQAKEFNRPIEEIRRARERIQYALEAATAEQEKEEEAARWKRENSRPKKF